MHVHDSLTHYTLLLYGAETGSTWLPNLVIQLCYYGAAALGRMYPNTA